MSDLSGNKLFQERARNALPLLVRQAKAEQPIIYEDLAQELDMTNPRNLNYVLGYVGEALQELGKTWGMAIPPIQSLAVNKETRVPGGGFWGLAELTSFGRASLKQKRQCIQKVSQDIFQFTRWDDVLRAFALQPVEASYTKLLSETPRGGYDGGESEDHKRLKEYISKHPQAVNLPKSISEGQTEHDFPSADAVDVLFVHGRKWIGVEVKAKHSPIQDIIRGIYQCVKYRALLEAMQMVEQKSPNAETVLAIEGCFPKDLLGLKNTLGIRVVDNITVS